MSLFPTSVKNYAKVLGGHDSTVIGLHLDHQMLYSISSDGRLRVRDIQEEKKLGKFKLKPTLGEINQHYQ